MEVPHAFHEDVCKLNMLIVATCSWLALRRNPRRHSQGRLGMPAGGGNSSHRGLLLRSFILLAAWPETWHKMAGINQFFSYATVDLKAGERVEIQHNTHLHTVIKQRDLE